MKATTKVGMAVAAVIGLTATFGAATEASAQSQNPCLPADRVEQMLLQNAGEQNSGSGDMRGDRQLELFSSEQGSYTFVTNNGQGERCLQSMGQPLIRMDDSEFTFELPEQELTPQQEALFLRMTQASRGQCGKPSAMFNNLSSRYQEEPVIVGAGPEGSVVVLLDTPEGALQDDGTPSGDSWTLVTIRKDHPNMNLNGAYSACVSASGENWQDLEVDEDVVVGPSLNVSLPAPN